MRADELIGKIVSLDSVPFVNGEGPIVTRITTQISKKFAITENGLLVKVHPDLTAVEIPHDEPLWLFRGRDDLARTILHIYDMRCREKGATQYQLDMNAETLGQFNEYALSHRTKLPGSTEGW
jgi:hypothetical protein